MYYSADWSVSEKAGEPVLEADVTKLFCFLINKKTNAIELTLTTDENDGITWVDGDAGEIEIEFPSDGTEDIIAGDKKYEVWALFDTGAKALVDEGEFKLFASKAAAVVVTP